MIQHFVYLRISLDVKSDNLVYVIYQIFELSNVRAGSLRYRFYATTDLCNIEINIFPHTQLKKKKIVCSCWNSMETCPSRTLSDLSGLRGERNRSLDEEDKREIKSEKRSCGNKRREYNRDENRVCAYLSPSTVYQSASRYYQSSLASAVINSHERSRPAFTARVRTAPD